MCFDPENISLILLKCCSTSKLRKHGECHNLGDADWLAERQRKGERDGGVSVLA